MDETLPTTWQVEFIDKKEFVKAMLDENVKAFVIYISSLSLKSIYPDKEAQIASLLIKEVTFLDKYLYLADIFLEQQVLVLSKQTELNQYTIKLQDGKQPLYGPIYNLRLVELKTLKTYIETNQGNNFIQPFK